MGETKKVLTELKNGVLIVTINREERRNAIDPETSAMMEQILNDAEQNPEVGAIIITGTGDRSFCSGEDLAALMKTEPVRQLWHMALQESQNVFPQNRSSVQQTELQ